ncbi:MAG TPA: hypothetical protein VLH84_00090 [Patescibacteria group bacterium]|nr:hypothetical protein [Patescibacteria group bacterium]
MPIIKSLPLRIVSWQEAMASHLRHAQRDELDELRAGRSWHALRFAQKFQRLGLAALFFTKPSPYEVACSNLANDTQAVGRAACVEQCQLCISVTPVQQPDESSATALQTVCRVQGCPEDGLRTVDAAYGTMQEDAAVAIRSVLPNLLQ